MASISERIDKIGEQVAHCNLRCSGVVCDTANGKVPRCLYLEELKCRSGVGTVVVGINPGRASAEEVGYYKENGSNYSVLKEFFLRRRAFRYRYYVELRRLLKALGLSGPILWTELVKCESEANVTLPLQTFRRCTHTFLQKELQAALDWPILAVGREPYKAAAYLESTRAVLGVPHPKGSRGQWHRLFSGDNVRPEVLRAAAEAIKNRTAIWFSEILIGV